MATVLGVVGLSFAGVAVGPEPAFAVDSPVGPPATCASINPPGVTAQVDEDDENLFTKFITSLIENAGSSLGSDGAGWLMNLMLGHSGNQSPTPTEQEILQQLAEQSQQLTDIQNELTTLQTELNTDVLALEAKIADAAFADAQATITNGVAGDMNGAIGNLCAIIATYNAQDAPNAYQPYPTDIAQIEEIRTNGLSNLNTLHTALTESQGLIQLYQQEVWANLAVEYGQEPNQQLLTSSYMSYMQSFLGYYVGLATQYFNAYAEAIHWESDASDTHGAPALAAGNTTDLTLFGEHLQAYVNQWTAMLTYDIPSIAEGTLVDTRTNLVWQTAPVTLAGTNANQYCYHQAPLCTYTVWNSTNSAVVAERVVPSVVPVEQYMGNQFPDWTAPSQADWQALVSPGTTGVTPYSAGGGVAQWAAANDFDLLKPQTFPQQLGGTVTTIPPVIASDGDIGGTEVLSFNGTYAGTPVAQTAGPGRGFAGQLTMNTPVTQVVPFPDAGNNTPPAAVPGNPPPAPATPVAPPTGPTPEVGTLNTLTAFTAAGACTQAFQVPAGANAVEVTVTGAPGGDSGTYTGNVGGAGAVITATLPARAGATFYPQVGGPGSTSRDDGSSTPGGFGGGGSGGEGRFQQSSDTGTESGAGGGGMSGISLTPDCSDWVAIAGGGGGAGGGGDSNGKGGDGGHGCVTGAGCNGLTPTNSNGSSATDDGAGIGGTLPGGGNSGHHKGHPAGAGTNGTAFAGGPGGTGQSSSFSVTDGGGGGGGGGGYGGGGGGGGSDNGYNGAGGAGGGSFLLDGVARAAYSAAPTHTPASVTFKPVVADEYTIWSYSLQEFGTPAVWDNWGRSSDPGNPINTNPNNGGPNQNWALVPLSNLGTPDTPQYEIVNPATQMCASSVTTVSLTLQPCLPTSETAADGQNWTPQAAVAVGNYAVIDSNGNGATAPPRATQDQITFTAFSLPGDLFQGWSFNLAPGGIWAAAAASNPLAGFGAEEDPNAPGGSGGVGPRASGAARGGVLPATGFDDGWAAGAGLGLLLVGLMVVTLSGRTARSNRRDVDLALKRL